jgi:hypothetical protein
MRQAASAAEDDEDDDDIVKVLGAWTASITSAIEGGEEREPGALPRTKGLSSEDMDALTSVVERAAKIMASSPRRSP